MKQKNMILKKTVKVTIVPKNIKQLSKKYPKIKINDVIEIDVNDLNNGSGVFVECQCEICGIKNKIQYRKYVKNILNYNYYSCKSCKNIKTTLTKEYKYGDGNYNNSKKMIHTKEKLGIYIPYEQTNDFKYYRKIVNRFTYKSKKILLMNWNGYDEYDGEYIQNYLKLKSKNMLYPTIDHKISIHEGFIKNIPPYIIGSVENICITKRMINLLKRNRIKFIFNDDFRKELEIVKQKYKLCHKLYQVIQEN